MDTFTQGARRARSTERSLARDTEDSSTIRRDRFRMALVLSILGVFIGAMSVVKVITVPSSSHQVSTKTEAAFRSTVRLGGGRLAEGLGKPRGGDARLGEPRVEGSEHIGVNGFTLITTPIVFVSLGTENDNARVKASIGKLVTRSRMTAPELKNLVTISNAVDATAWPANIHLVEYAVKDIRTMAAENGKTLMDLPWVQVVELAKQHENQELPQEWRALSHHVGCLYAHMFQWQLVKDQGWKKAIIFEADGVGLSDLPFTALQEAIDRMPVDADVMFTSFGNTKGGNLEFSWDSRNEDGSPVKVNMYKWNTFQSMAGLGVYIISDSFVERIQRWISHKGADMVDAWILGRLCVVGRDAEWNERGMNEGIEIVDNRPILNCYHATTWS